MIDERTTQEFILYVRDIINLCHYSSEEALSIALKDFSIRERSLDASRLRSAFKKSGDAEAPEHALLC